MLMAITFHSEDIKYVIKHKRALKSWITACIESEKKKTGQIDIIFCSDEYLLDMNRQFLNHDYYTDIITFNYNDENTISGDLFISENRVRDNAEKLNIPKTNEMQRVIIHGVMHLCGYNDKSKSDVLLMRKMETKALKRLPPFLKIPVPRGTKIKLSQS